jgi:hypothetical protein
MTAQIDAASRPRLMDRLITWVLVAGFIGVQGAWTVFLGWGALGVLAEVVNAPNIEVPPTLTADQPPSMISGPAEEALAAEAPKVPLTTASIFSPPSGNPKPVPKGMSDRAMKKQVEIKHALVQATPRRHSVGPKKYVRQRDRLYYAKLRQQYIAPHQHYFPHRGWGGGQFGPSPYSEAGQ